MIRERSLVRLFAGGKPSRTGVVLRLLADGRFFVTWGTGTDLPEARRVVVEDRTRDGRALGLYKPTYFYKGNIVACAEERLESLHRDCPPALFLKLKALYGL
jgi:hypothetical protein